MAAILFWYLSFLFQAYEALSGKDHSERTLLMHAAAAGKAPLFGEVFHAMEIALTDEQVTVVSCLKTCSRLVHV